VTELIAGETEDGEALLFVVPVKRFEAGVLRREAALARDVDDELSRGATQFAKSSENFQGQPGSH
jgi:hypothetical protein